MNRMRRHIAALPYFWFTLLTGVIAIGASEASLKGITNGLLVIILVVGLYKAAWQSQQTIRHGYFGIHLLAAIGILVALVENQFLAGSILALLLSLEDLAIHTLPLASKESLTRTRHATIAKLFDTATLPYTVFVLLAGGAAWLTSGDITRFLVVILSASTIPLTFVSPLVLSIGTQKLKNVGINIRSIKKLELLAQIRSIVLDTLGVVTDNTLHVKEVTSLGGHSKSDVLKVAYALTTTSEQAVAIAIQTYVKNTSKSQGAKHTTEELGRGISGRMKGVNLRIGYQSYMQSQGIDIPKLPSKRTNPVVFIAENGKVIGYITFSESILPGIKIVFETIRKKLGVTHMSLISSHDTQSLANLASKVGIKDMVGDTTPTRAVDYLSSVAKPVAFVSSNALSEPIANASDVSIIIDNNGGFDVTIDNYSPRRLLTALTLPRRTLRTAQICSIGGLFVCFIAVAIATTGLLQPIQAILTNGFISITILLISYLMINQRARG